MGGGGSFLIFSFTFILPMHLLLAGERLVRIGRWATHIGLVTILTVAIAWANRYRSGTIQH
jgi:hypothetical protein